MDAPPGSDTIPLTLVFARRADLSQTTRTAIELAAALAQGRSGGGRRALGLAELIGGMVIVGEQERERVRKETRGPWLIAGFFAEALERLVGASRIAETVAAPRPEPPGDLLLSPQVRAALVAARGIAEATVGRTRIDARHLLAALVAPPEAPALAAALRRIWHRDWAISPDSLRAPILAAIEQVPELGENLAAWRHILGVPTVAPAAFAADAPAAGDDALGRRADAKRLAELACLADNAPPLAIGLFGDWGSGKSTFMAMMQREVERIGTAWKDDDAGPFVTRVAQIRFNAWSFADANLWASLAVEIFEGLRDELARLEGTGDAASRRARTLLAEISARTAQARAARAEADRAVADARKAVAELDARLSALDARLAGGTPALAERAGSILVERREELTALLRELGAIGPTEAATIERLAEEARTLAASGRGGFAVARRVVKLASSRIAVTLGVAIALALTAAWLAPPGALEAAAATLAFLAPFAARIVSALNRLSPLLDTVEAEAKAEADLRRERAAVAEAREAAARALTEREAAAARALSGAEAVEKAAATPQEMLRFFLNESEELRGYEREIGLIGRLRKTFQRLDDLMAQQSPKDPRAPRPDLPVLDRIILYIDDLDRLREAEVVKVLEAVALLLQFRLFVVVVAVDARWLEGALRRHYAGQFGEGQGENAPGPGDYLEKIFQVPFWLPRLAPGGAEFAGLARVLLPEGAEAGPAEPAAKAPAAAMPALADGAYAIDPDELPQPGDGTPAETRAAEVKRVTLTKAEADVLAALMPLAATGPRAAKRFVNLYRLARAGRDGEALRRFLGQDGEAPDYVAFAFLLACQTGLGRRGAEGMSSFLARYQNTRLSNSNLPSSFAEMLKEARISSPKYPEINQCLSPLADVIPAIHDRILELPRDQRLSITIEKLALLLPEATRYSFHAPGLDRAAPPANPAEGETGSTA
jgi:hypothetical protein